MEGNCMVVPPAEHKVWSDIVTGRRRIEFGFLAANIFLGRAALSLRNGSTPELVRKSATELRDLFARNSQLATVQRDMRMMFE